MSEEMNNALSSESGLAAEPMVISNDTVMALSAALSKIAAYVPTNYVDNMEPDINAEHLNKNEQALKAVTDLMNNAVDVIEDLQSQVTQLNSKIGYGYVYDGVKTFSTIFTEMAGRTTILFDIQGGSPIANELGYPSAEQFGATIFVWKITGWRGGAISIPLDGWTNNPVCIAEIDGAANTFSWKKLALKDDLANDSIELTLSNGFQTPDSAYIPLMAKRAVGITIISGNFNAGSNLSDWTTITTIPSGYRPSKQIREHYTSVSGGEYNILIGSNGVVQIYNATSVSEGDMLFINAAY